MKLVAFISGAGQDASYLAELLLDKNYEVILFSKRNSVVNSKPLIDALNIDPSFTFIEGDICDSTFISGLLHKYKPHEFYNTAAQSHVGYSFKNPLETFKVNAEAPIMHLECIRKITPYTKYLNCATSEMFGGLNVPQDGFSEYSSLYSKSPYGTSKIAAFQAVRNYREAYNMFAVSSISFNHSSTRRGLDFATRKITHGIASIKLGLQQKIKMGDLSAFRDESHAKDIVEGMYLMMQQTAPEDFVFCSGNGATLKEMYDYVSLISGTSFDETYEYDPQFSRPSEVQYLIGNSKKARSVLGWEPKYSWRSLLKEMYEYDYRTLQQEIK